MGIAAGCLAAVVSVTAAQAEGMRCNGRLVEVGESQGEVRLKCGGPALSNSYDEELYEKSAGGAEVRTVSTFEQWVYNFGPNRLVQIVTFRNGRVESIVDGDYGTTTAARGDECSGGQRLRNGLSLAEVEMKCGAPQSQKRWRETVTEPAGEGWRMITVDEWFYAFGPDRLTLKLRFENGRLAAMESGGRGN